MEEIYIKDANVLIDLHAGGLLGAWFDLGRRTITTSLVLLELRSLAGADVREHLEIEDVAGDDMPAVLELMNQHRISLPDASVFYLALNRGAILVTGDGRLRSGAAEEGVRVHGTLWILDELIEAQAILPAAAANALELILSAGTFLPPLECRSRLEDWRS